MDYLLQALKTSDFGDLLAAYKSVGMPLRGAIDGGAGYGSTAVTMLEHMSPDTEVFAYEPFPGNHRFFQELDPRIVLKKKALADSPGRRRLSVGSVVAEGSAWAEKGLLGYSSAGSLVQNALSSEHDVEVDVVKADDDISEERQIDFVKLDLQGGEYAAINGMRRILSGVQFAWIEYLPSEIADPYRVYQRMNELGFLVFDTEYMFKGAPNAEIREQFEVSKEGHRLSSGSMIWYGYKKRPWIDFRSEIKSLQERHNLIQTDICCVNRRHIGRFIKALSGLE